MQLTKYVRELIKDAITSTQSTDRLVLCEFICLTLEERYPSDKNLEYQLRRLKLTTTREILAAVDFYIYEKNEQELEEKSQKEQLELFYKLGRV